MRKYIELGSHMKLLRETLFLSRSEVGLQAGCDYETVRKLENGEIRASSDMMERLLKLYGPGTEGRKLAWILLAQAYIPEGVRKRVKVIPARGSSPC